MSELPRRSSEASDAYRAITETLRTRHSCRGFRSEPVPRRTLLDIFEAARSTASWCNAQPWKVWLLSGARLDQFRQALLTHIAATKPEPDFAWPREYRNEYLARRRECGFALYDAVGIAKGDREASGRQSRENFRFFGAPHLAIVTTDEALGVYGAIDCGAWTHTFMLAAESLGVATIAQASVAGHARWIRQHLGIGDDRQVICAISIGLEDTTHPANGFRTTRAPLDETLVFLDEALSTNRDSTAS